MEHSARMLLLLMDQYDYNRSKDKAGKTTTVTRKVTLDTAAPVIKSITLTPNPVDCGKTFVIAVEVTD